MKDEGRRSANRYILGSKFLREAEDSSQTLWESTFGTQ